MAVQILYLPDRHQVRSADDAEIPLLLAYGWTVAPATAQSAAVQHIQVTPMATWTIPHGLGRIPCVQIYDILGRQVDTDVEATIPLVVITFPAPAVGVAVLT